MRLMMKKILGLLLLIPLAGNAQEVTLTAVPNATFGTVIVDLTWTSTGVDACLASGGWTGVRSTAGTEQVTIYESTEFVLSCSRQGGSARLSWRAPTERTDGTALTSLKDHLLYASESQGSLEITTPITVPMPTLEYTFTLPAGTWYFGAKARDENNITSAMSGTVSKVIEDVNIEDRASVSIVAPPRPPVLVTVETVVYEISSHPRQGYRVWRPIGEIALGVECNPDFNIGDYYEVPASDVTFKRFPAIPVVVTRCG
jgi:hypothetical protein